MSVAADSTLVVQYAVHGSLPAGVTLTGTPTTSGRFTFTVTAKTAAGTDSQQ